MRKITYGGACSLDGYLAATDGSVDWLHFSKDVSAIMAEYWAKIDTLIMGRKTWEVAQAMGSGEGMGAGIKPYVFSRTLRTIDQPGVELVRGDAAEFVRALKREKGKEICVFGGGGGGGGGGGFARSLFEAGLIDEVGLNIHPVLLGAGIPVFRDAGRIKLKLRETREIHGGCVLATYGVQGKNQKPLTRKRAESAERR